jgi:anti-anti-sigma factor
MQPGSIGVADKDGIYVIKMTGDVRLTLCLSFDSYIAQLFNKDDFQAIFFNLTQADAIDSTTLGLMAKISLMAKERKNIQPTIISSSPSINRLLECMGFSQIFTIVDDAKDMLCPQSGLDKDDLCEDTVREKVLEAHRILMDLNKKNAETFKDLVNCLEIK